MARTLGSKNKSTLAREAAQRTDAAQPSIATGKQDGYVETFAVMNNNAAANSPRGGINGGLVSQAEAVELYMGNGWARRIVEIPAREMTRAGFDLENVTDDLKEKIQARVEELDVMRSLNQALAWSRLFGGAVVVLGINDGGALDVPANLESAKSLEFLRVYDRFSAVVGRYVTDTSVKEYGQPETWRISPQMQGATMYEVHASRVLVFDGDMIPDQSRNMNQGWGGSVLQACRTELTRLNMAHFWSNAALERSAQAVHGIPRLGQMMLSKNGDTIMQARANAVDLVRSIINTVIVDAEETYEIKTSPVSGHGDLLDRFAEALSAVTGIPIYLLMGRSPGGLNASGANNESAWHDMVSASQNDILRRPLDRIISLIFRGLSGNDGGAYKLVFNPLKTATAAEEGEIRKATEEAEKARMETLSGYIVAGIMDAKEARIIVAKDYDLDEELDIPNPDKEILAYEAELNAERDKANAETAAATAAKAPAVPRETKAPK